MMEARHSLDDNLLNVRPRSKDFLRVKSEELSCAGPVKDRHAKKDSMTTTCQKHPSNMQHHQPLRFVPDIPRGCKQEDHEQSNLLYHFGMKPQVQPDSNLENPTENVATRLNTLNVPQPKASICTPSALMTKQHIQRKHQQKLTRQSVVEESTPGNGAGTKGNGGGRECNGGTGSGGEILDKVEQLTRQLVRVCVGKRNCSLDMGEAAAIHISVSPKVIETKKKSPNSTSSFRFGSGKKTSTEKGASAEGVRREQNDTKSNNLDVVEAPLKAFFLRNRNNTSSLRGGKKITGAPGEEAASLAAAYTEEEKYPWGRRLEDAPWRSPMYSVIPDHRQRCTRCLTYFHFTAVNVPESNNTGAKRGGDTAGGGNTREPTSRGLSASQSVRSKRAKLQKMKSLQSKWEARKGQLYHTKSAPSTREDDPSEDHVEHARLKVRHSWAKYGQHSYDSRMALAEDDEDNLYSTKNSSPSSNFLRPPLSEGQTLMLRENEARLLSQKTLQKNQEVCMDENVSKTSREHDLGPCISKIADGNERGTSACYGQTGSECSSHSTELRGHPVSIVVEDAFPTKKSSNHLTRSNSFRDKKLENPKLHRCLSKSEHHAHNSCENSNDYHDRDKQDARLLQPGDKPERHYSSLSVSPGLLVKQKSLPLSGDDTAVSRDSSEIVGGPWVFTNVAAPAKHSTGKGESPSKSTLSHIWQHSVDILIALLERF
ncbi:hypothetical protein ElyMa_003224100 [Elysia marginata]|uniref:Uncharacterized protein n=1 Tax=Elysia marginata TaxID=1093978 RepID=A0AAV4J3I3_9GAST|nr:hypothetical protein ElyMa_003224100 [Elysia marginata]